MYRIMAGPRHSTDSDATLHAKLTMARVTERYGPVTSAIPIIGRMNAAATIGAPAGRPSTAGGFAKRGSSQPGATVNAIAQATNGMLATAIAGRFRSRGCAVIAPITDTRSTSTG